MAALKRGAGRTAGILGATAVAGAIAAAAGARGRARAARPPVRRGTFANSIEYAALGTGPRNVLFLPGGPGTPTWDKALARSFLPAYATGEFTVWWLSRRRNMPTGHTVADMADDVAEVVVELGGRVDAVIGASYGGLIALQLAARHPGLVGRVVLLGSTAVIPEAAKALDRQWGEAWGNGRFTEAGAGMLAEALPDERLRRLRRLLAPLAGRWLASLPHNLSDVLVETQAEMDYDARAVLSQITAPVLIIAGGRDLFLPREVIEETASGIADCQVIWHPGDGHAGTIRSKRSAVETLAFLSGARAGSGAAASGA